MYGEKAYCQSGAKLVGHIGTGVGDLIRNVALVAVWVSMMWFGFSNMDHYYKDTYWIAGLYVAVAVLGLIAILRWIWNDKPD